MLSKIIILCKRDIWLAKNNGGHTLLGIVFYLTVITIIPFAVGPDHKLISQIGPGILWLGLLLASLLSLSSMFKDDNDDASLEMAALAAIPLETVVIAKCLAQWLLVKLPLLMVTPFFALVINMEAKTILITVLTMIIASPAVVMITAIGAAIATAIGRGSLLSATLIFPLIIPIIIFALGIVNSFTAGADYIWVPLLMLAAINVFFIAMGSVAGAMALRIALE